MYTKIYITLLFILLAPLSLKATGQEPDIIFINGEKWFLLGKPIDADSTLYFNLREFLPKNIVISTSNWSGYTAFWTIENDYLYLDSIEVWLHDEKSEMEYTIVFDADTLKTVFDFYFEQNSICASWYNGEIRAGKGKLIRYIHLGFNRNVETERIMTVENGKIVKTDYYCNFRKPGMDLLDHETQKELCSRFPWYKFPELKGARLVFSFGNFKIGSDGELLDFDVNLMSILLPKEAKDTNQPSAETMKDPNNPLVIEFRETVKSIYPLLEVYYIYDRFMLQDGFIGMPLIEINYDN